MSPVFTDVDAIIGKLFEMNNSNTVLENDWALVYKALCLPKSRRSTSWDVA